MTREIVTEQEEWRDIPGFPDYQASTAGRIRSFKRKKPHVLSNRLSNPNEYILVTLQRDGQSVPMKVHRLIALTFLGPCPDGMQVCHNDGDCHNNRLDNLRHDTLSGNAHDATVHAMGFKMSRTQFVEWLTGLLGKVHAPPQDFALPGWSDGQAVWLWTYLTGGDAIVSAAEAGRRRAREIRAWRAQGLLYREIAEKYDMTVGGVCRICKGNRHAEAGRAVCGGL